MGKISDQRLESERVQMESEMAQLQLRFYTAPPDKKLLVALGQAVREMKKQERDAADVVSSTRTNSGTKPDEKAGTGVDSEVAGANGRFTGENCVDE